FSLIFSAHLVRNKFRLKFKVDELKVLFLLISFVFLVNFIRIIVLIKLAIIFGPKVFEFFHTILWREVMIFFVGIFFYFYLKNFGI
ncbi:MAG: hypothetical protein RMJ17_00295, partial [Candidatus Aenigmarchaeota archaeon]|nr:hypothetical protein [Candidatus Aenigmarchaeota archaeon]MDW8149030.1 hypothetical protein [Candidatus Aenigmarchaeota archaeon]